MEALFERDDMAVLRLNMPDEIEPLLRLFEETAAEQGWQPGDQLRAYTDSSLYFAVSVAGCLIGGLQLVLLNSTDDLPCLTVWPELELLGHTEVADVALIAFLPEFRGKKRLFWSLLVELWRYCAENGIQHLWMEITERTLRLYRKLGWPLEVEGPLRLHWGEECFPCSVTVRGLEELFLRKARLSPLYYDFVAQAYHDRPEKLREVIAISGEPV